MKTIIIDGVEYDLTPKTLFKKGDWITNDRYVKLIVGINSDFPFYMFEDGTSKRIKDIDKRYHLWTIQDAKDGDVLATNSWLYLFKYTNNKAIIQFHCNCPINRKPYKWSFLSDECYLDIYINANIHPATKEQRDLLFAKMKEAGYEWDAEKKELKKIEQNPAWSEEDEKFFKTALWHISYSISNGKSTDIHCDATDWLKSLKERVRGE